ncbi:hypothetical protein ABH922_004863 [Rhodococcus sp. 27YEA15]|uniref:ESX secretion-associated protein EspG n=1 Tax=Rhodococcus sp. 27YEA15 TaxID=3156259 RepID=UPI003C7D9057
MVDLGIPAEWSGQSDLTLTRDEIDYARDHLGLDALPVVLGGTALHDSIDARTSAMSTAAETLARRELLVGGVLDPDLGTLLQVLTHPLWSLALRRSIDGTMTRWCVAEGENLRIVASVAGENIVLHTSTAEPAAIIADIFGPAEAMALAAFNAPTTELSAAFGAGPEIDQLVGALERVGVGTPDSGRLGTALLGCSAFAELVGIARSPALDPPGPVTVFDTRAGRLVGSSSAATDGTVWTSVSSGTPARLRQAVNSLVSSLVETVPLIRR